MECDKEKVPRIVQAASEQAGAFLGTSVAIGKKIAGLGAKSAAAMSGLLGLSAKQSAPAASTLKAMVTSRSIIRMSQATSGASPARYIRLQSSASEKAQAPGKLNTTLEISQAGPTIIFLPHSRHQFRPTAA